LQKQPQIRHTFLHGIKEKGETMTKADLIEEVSRVVEMTRKEAEVIVEAIFDSIVRSLRASDKIEIRGFGKPQDRRARGSPCKEDPLLQTQQGIEGHREHFVRRPGPRNAARSRFRAVLNGPPLEPLALSIC
jgi:hypothetical protein